MTLLILTDCDSSNRLCMHARHHGSPDLRLGYRGSGAGPEQGLPAFSDRLLDCRLRACSKRPV